MTKLANRINLLIMPTDMCNMNCLYCFHNAHNKKTEKMSTETLRRIYDITFKDFSDVTIIWHGGEPLMMGLDFYKDALEMQKDYKVKITNRMQSNLTLLTDEMAEFLCSNNVSIGSSFDGCLNEELRGKSHQVIQGRNKILKYEKNCGFILVLSRKNCDNLIESYQYFKSIKANFTINPYVPTNNSVDRLLRLDPEQTIEKIKELFEYWLNDSLCNIHIDYFERIIRFVLFGEKSVCKYNSCLGKWVGIRHNGDITPCNRFFPDEYKYGNVWDYSNLSEAFVSEGFRNILTKAIQRREKCKNCIAFPLCSGGCNNVALNENGIENNGGDSCYIFKEIYKHITKKIIALIQNNEYKKTKNPLVNALLNTQGRRKTGYFHFDEHCDSVND